MASGLGREPHTRFGGSPLCLGADPGQCPRAVAHRRPQQPRLCAVPPPPREHAWPHEAGLLETPLGSAHGDTGPSRQRLTLFFKSENSSCVKLRVGCSSGETLHPFLSRMGSVSRRAASSVPGGERGPSRSCVRPASLRSTESRRWLLWGGVWGSQWWERDRLFPLYLFFSLTV